MAGRTPADGTQMLIEKGWTKRLGWAVLGNPLSPCPEQGQATQRQYGEYSVRTGVKLRPRRLGKPTR